MPNKFLSSMHLARLHVVASFLLPFFIASLGGILVSRDLEDLKVLPLFFLGSITARGAGCIINDIFDRDFDSKVARTKNRPLASGALSLRFAVVQLLIFSLISFLILTILPPVAIYTAIVAAIMITCYPLMKRVTHLPQVFLGFTYSLASLIGYATITNNISASAFILYLAIASWTIGFDIIYGFMDINDDKKINVKSMAIWLKNRNYKIWIACFYITFIVLFYISFGLNSQKLPEVFQLSILCSITILMWQVKTLDITNPANCMMRFKSNIYVGGILMLGAISIKLYI